MRLLLDTHIWFWLATDVGRIGRVARRELTDSSNELWVSPISTWEVLMLLAKGRIRINGEPKSWLANATRGTQEAVLTHEIAAVAAQIPLHRDPADRFLVATAQVLDLLLVTADEKLLGLGTVKTLANR